MQSNQNFYSGINYLWRGFATLKNKHILPFVVVPVLINIALFYFGLSYLYELGDGWLASFIASTPAWLSFIEWLFKAVFYVAAALLVAFGFTFAATLIGSPFYGLMAEQVERINNSQTSTEALTITALIKIVPRTLIRELQKLLYYVLRLLPLALLSLLSLVITPLATIMPFIWFWFGAKMLTIQYVDYAYDNNGLSFKAMRKDLKKRKRAGLGFGSVTTVVSMMPLINIVAIPAAVCGGTLFYLEQSEHKRNGS